MAPGPGPGEEKQSRAGGATKEGREAVCVVVTTPVAVEVVCVAALGVFVRLTPLKKGAVGLVETALWERRGEIGGGVGTVGRTTGQGESRSCSGSRRIAAAAEAQRRRYTSEVRFMALTPLASLVSPLSSLLAWSHLYYL